MSVLSFITGLFKRTPPRKRIESRLVSYEEAEKLLKEGWTIAPEEDHNHNIGIVYLERLG